MTTSKNLIHKETFFQDCCTQGVPSHWVVLYYDANGSVGYKSKCFKNQNEALDFEDTLKCQ